MEDTIAAVATALGEGGIGIVRISGENAKSILDQIFISVYDNAFENRKLVYGHVIDEERKTIDEALAVYMKAPNTYTKEDVVEINCHGSIVSLKKTLELVLRKGARIADRGEFTKRAFLNGRLDLSQAEAVIDMIKAKTDKGYEVALNQLEGHLSVKITELRDQILELLAHVIVNIDYPDDDIEEITYENLKHRVKKINDEVKTLLKTSDTGKILKEGLNTVIIGKPNVGKSSLMNALLRESRAIVTEVPGTTRDTIEEMVNINHIPLRIIDTAGIRETEDVVEKIGVEKSKESFNKADLIIFILNASEELSQEDREIMKNIENKKAIILLNKTDLPEKIDINEVKKKLPMKKIIYSSIVNRLGILELEEEITKMVYSGEVRQEESLLITNARHVGLLEKAKNSLNDALDMIDNKEALDFIEVDIRSAWETLGEIIGETVSEDIINEVFSRFCLGK